MRSRLKTAGDAASQSKWAFVSPARFSGLRIISPVHLWPGDAGLKNVLFSLLKPRDRWPLTALALLLLLVLSGCGVQGGDPLAVELRDLNQHRLGADSAAGLGAGRSIAQSFRADRDGLSRIEIQLKAYPAALVAGSFQLKAGAGLDGPAVVTLPLSAADFSHNPYLDFSFAPVEHSAGQIYTFVLDSPATPLAKSITVHMSALDSYSAGAAYLDGQVQPNDLTFSAYYAYTPADIVGDIATALTANAWLALVGLAFLLLPGLVLGGTLWRGLNGPALLAAPGLTLLAWPVLLLVFSTVGLRLGALLAWGLLLVAVVALLWRFLRRKTDAHQGEHGEHGENTEESSGVSLLPMGEGPGVRSTDIPVTTTLPVRRHDSRRAAPGWAYWVGLAVVLGLTLLFRLAPLRELWAGMGLDAYHHTLVIQMFLDAGGVPANYLPYAPLASFTYHFGFHAFAAALDWLAPGTLPVERLMVLAGQLAGTLPVLSLALFGWRVLGDRRLGLIAGALAGLVAIFPAFYLNWSRYTQSLGLALLPFAWVVLFDALKPFFAGRVSWRTHTPALLLAAVCCVGLFVSHYRIFAMFASYAALIIVPWLARALLRRVGVTQAIGALALVGGGTIILAAPWLLNLRENFTTRFAGSADAGNAGYYDLASMLGDVPRQFWSTSPLIALAALGLAWCLVRGKWPGIALGVWLGLHLLWGNPTAFPFKLPGAGYVDSVTVVTSAFVPITLLAAYPLLGLFRLAQEAPYLLGRFLVAPPQLKWWRPAVGAVLGGVGLIALLLSGISLLPILDVKPYVGAADIAGMTWLRANTPADALVLGSGFGQSWGPDAVQGADAALWTPLLAGRASTLPPIPAYNERPVTPDYLPNAINIVRYSYDLMRDDVPAQQQQKAWDNLRDDGVDYIFVGSRGGVLDAARLLAMPDRVTQVFHQDGVWIFRVRN